MGTGNIFTPRQVSFGPQANLTMPYLQPKPMNATTWGGGSGQAPNNSGTTPPAQDTSTTLGAETVRATGTGPFDPAYRQNLATYAGGQFARPGGNLSFDPTGSLFGNPTGGGNAPVLGMPDSLVGQALGGNPFSFTPPAPATPPAQDQFTDPLGFWKDQFLNNGRMFGGAGIQRFLGA